MLNNKVYNLTAGFFFTDPRFNWRSQSPSWLFLKNKNLNFNPRDFNHQFYYEFPQTKQYIKNSNYGKSNVDIMIYDQNFSSGHPIGCCPEELVKEVGFKTSIYFKFYYLEEKPFLYISFLYECNAGKDPKSKQYYYTLGDPSLEKFISASTNGFPFDRWKSLTDLTNVNYLKFELPEGIPLGAHNCYTGSIDKRNLEVRNPINFDAAIFNGMEKGPKWSYLETAQLPETRVQNFGFADHELSYQNTGPRYFYVFANYEPPGTILSDLKGN